MNARGVGGHEAMTLLSTALASERHRLVVDPHALVCVPRLLGDAAARRSQPAKAREYYEDALDVTAKTRFRPEAALTRLHLAQLLALHFPAERAEALAHLDTAIGEFRAMAMTPSLERASAVQADLQRSTPSAKPAYPSGLSKREVEVLQLLATGKSNREIAEVLVISPGTVARHLTNIFNKIDVANRTEAARYATDHGLA